MSSIYMSIDSSRLPNVQSDNFTIRFNRPIVLNTDMNNPKEWEVALIQANMWYSWNNIDTNPNYNNNTVRYSYDGGGNWVTVVFPDGAWEVNALDAYLKEKMSENGHTDTTDPSEEKFYIEIVPNFTTLRVDLKISNNYRLDLSIGDFHLLIGLNPAIYTIDTFGQNAPDITRGLNELHIHSSLIGDTYINGEASDIMWTFRPETYAGGALTVIPSQIIYQPVKSTYQLATINMYITDQLGRRVDFNGEDVSYTIHIREKVKVK